MNGHRNCRSIDSTGDVAQDCSTKRKAWGVIGNTLHKSRVSYLSAYALVKGNSKGTGGFWHIRFKGRASPPTDIQFPRRKRGPNHEKDLHSRSRSSFCSGVALSLNSD